MKSSLFLAALLTFATPAAGQHPAAQLHCIYEGVDTATRTQAGEKFFFQDSTPPPPAALFAQAARDCVSRHGWSAAELAPAARYALSRAGREFGRGWLAARGIPPERIDQIYDSTARADRLADRSATIRNRMLSLLAAIGADEHIERVAGYVVMLRQLERSELEWAALPN
jgi:hypothetical protein